MCDASNFRIGASLLQSRKGTNKRNLNSAISRLFTQEEIRSSTLMREYTAIINTLTEFKFLFLGSKHPTVLFTDHKPANFLFSQKSIPNHRVYRFRLILMKFPNLNIVWTAGKKPCFSTYTQSEHTTRKNNKENDSRSTAKYKIIPCKKRNVNTSRTQKCNQSRPRKCTNKNLHYFPVYLDCQNKHYEVDLLGNSINHYHIHI